MSAASGDGAKTPSPDEVDRQSARRDDGGQDAGRNEGVRNDAGRSEGVRNDGGRISGEAAVADANARASSTRDINLDSLPPLPDGVPLDTANVRLGPEISESLLAALPLVGVWRGTGRFGNEPGERTPQFGQQLSFAHDGRAFLRYESVTWLLDDDGQPTGPGEREVGWLRAVDDGLTLVVAHSAGGADLLVGHAAALTRWEFAGATGSRLYGVTPDGRLAYVDERLPDGATDGEPQPYASAVLERIAG